MSNEVIVNLNDVIKVKKFSQVCQGFEPDIDIASLCDPKYIIDAKSVMGVFSIDLSRKAIVRIISDDENILNKFQQEMSAFT